MKCVGVIQPGPWGPIKTERDDGDVATFSMGDSHPDLLHGRQHHLPETHHHLTTHKDWAPALCAKGPVAIVTVLHDTRPPTKCQGCPPLSCGPTPYRTALNPIAWSRFLSLGTY